RGEPKVASRADPLRNCYIDLLSPLRACDPWAVHSAMTYVKEAAANLELTAVQQKIVEILQNDGPQEPANLCARLQIKYTDLERDIAALRHMQKIRGELRGGKKLICLW
ncbi:MAG: hypothetical protein JSW26_08105, partial [Desulfobacterales bacterium]